jgi:hypothetical protein
MKSVAGTPAPPAPEFALWPPQQLVEEQDDCGSKAAMLVMVLRGYIPRKCQRGIKSKPCMAECRKAQSAWGTFGRAAKGTGTNAGLVVAGWHALLSPLVRTRCPFVLENSRTWTRRGRLLAATVACHSQRKMAVASRPVFHHHEEEAMWPFEQCRNL